MAEPSKPKKTRAYVRERLREPSTWAGFAAVLGMGAAAYQTRDPQAIAAVVAGAVAMLTPERSQGPK